MELLFMLLLGLAVIFVAFVLITSAVGIMTLYYMWESRKGK